MLASIILTLTSLLGLISASPIIKRQSTPTTSTCSPTPTGTFNLQYAANTTLKLATYDCEACHGLGLYTGQIDWFSANSTENTGELRILSPNYGGQVLTVDFNAAAGVAPITRATAESQTEAQQDIFSFSCETCPTEGTGENCEIVIAQPTGTYPTSLCLTTDGQYNALGGISLEVCAGVVGQLFNVVAEE